LTGALPIPRLGIVAAAQQYRPAVADWETVRRIASLFPGAEETTTSRLLRAPGKLVDEFAAAAE
jgi:hypothetical protein